MKAYTDLEQSKKLAEILPLESADMGWYYSRNPQAARNQMWVGTKAENADILCWSLAALFEIIPKELKPSVAIDGNNNWLTYCDADELSKVDYSNLFMHNKELIDACYEMILKLHELKML